MTTPALRSALRRLLIVGILGALALLAWWAARAGTQSASTHAPDHESGAPSPSEDGAP